MAITYTYKCTNDDCDYYEHLYEVKQRITDDRLTFCSECQQGSLERVVVASSGFSLKGSGWTGKIGSTS